VKPENGRLPVSVVFGCFLKVEFCKMGDQAYILQGNRHSSISLKNRPGDNRSGIDGLGRKNRRKRFFLPKVGLISHFAEPQLKEG
jgi:hypothetical protein